MAGEPAMHSKDSGDGPLEVYCYRFVAKKRPIVVAAFAPTDRLHWMARLPPTRRAYAEARSRAGEALLTATRKPRQRWLFEARLALLAAQYNATRQFFEMYSGAVAVTWNGLVSDRRIFMLAARDAGARTLFFERGPFPQSITADPVGVNNDNGLPRDGEIVPSVAQSHAHGIGCLAPAGRSPAADTTPRNAQERPEQAAAT